jgi:hypothetical protein
MAKIAPRSWASLALLLAACTGQIQRGGTPPDPSTGSGPGPGGGGKPGPGGPGGTTTPGTPTNPTSPTNPTNPTSPTAPLPPGAPQPGRMRLLTRAQLENSLRDLLGPVDLGETPPDDVDHLASVGGTYDKLTDGAVEMYHAAIKAVLEGVFADVARRRALLSACTPSGPGDQACFRQLITGFGQRAWRRPLTPPEIDRYTSLALATATKVNDPFLGLLDATRGLLSSPYFLYRIELGEPDAKAAGRFRYSGYEMASRLSYFLTASTPDEKLMAAAAAKQLDTSDGVRAETARILATERGKQGFGNFAREFFTLDDFVRRPTDDPRYTATLRRAMADEVQALYAGLVTPGVDAFELFDTSKAFVNDELAKIYGITGVTSKTIVPAVLPAAIPRVGILGRGPFLAGSSADKAGAVAPILRGLFVAEHVLCKEVPPPPPGVPALPDVMPGAPLTPREQLERHRADPGCASCHALFDPLGLVFENFDAVGQYRDKDPSGKPIVTAGQLDGVAFKDSKELGGLLRASAEAESCFTTNLFWYAQGHVGTAADKALKAKWESDFPRLKRDLPQLLTEMAASDGFRYVSVPPPREDVDRTPDVGTPAPGVTSPPPPPVAPGTATPPPGDLAQMCDTYCKCMGSGKCSSRTPNDCVNTCKRDGKSWALACRIDKCKISQTDYGDQTEGDCSAAIGIHACWNAE